jgi:YHS domain-containing protein
MDWLTQNWVWILSAIGAVWLLGRGGMAGCGMGGHGSHAGHGGGTAPDGSSSGPMLSGGGAAMIPEKAVDPVSGNDVLTARAPSAVYRGQFFFFESAENRQRFEAAPREYVLKNALATQVRRRHGCC